MVEEPQLSSSGANGTPKGLIQLVLEPGHPGSPSQAAQGTGGSF